MNIKSKMRANLNLEKLKCEKRKMKGKNGDIAVLIIPIDANGLYQGKKGTYMEADIIEKAEPGQYGDIGFVAKRTNYKNVFGKDVEWKDLNEEQRKHLDDLSPILGDIKPIQGQGRQGEETESLPPVEEDDEENPLPF